MLSLKRGPRFLPYPTTRIFGNMMQYMLANSKRVT